MKCPYQTVTIHKSGLNCDDADTIETTEFGECWKKECPLYRTAFNSEYCQRAESEGVKN